MTTYAKALLAVLAAGVSAATVGLTGDGVVDSVEKINIAIAVITAASVFAGPNVPGARITKFVLAALGAVLTLAVNLIADGITTSEWLQLASAAVGAVLVYAVPNTQGHTVHP